MPASCCFVRFHFYAVAEPSTFTGLFPAMDPLLLIDLQDLYCLLSGERDELIGCIMQLTSLRSTETALTPWCGRRNSRATWSSVRSCGKSFLTLELEPLDPLHPPLFPLHRIPALEAVVLGYLRAAERKSNGPER